MAVSVPANQIATVLTLPGVAAVQPDALQHPLTDASPGFIGAPTIWDQEGGQANAGKGMIFGSLDTGIWPEHPSFADTGALGAPPAKADGTPRACVLRRQPAHARLTIRSPATTSSSAASPSSTPTTRSVGGEVYADRPATATVTAPTRPAPPPATPA